MAIMDYFKRVSTWTAQKVREFLQQKNYDEYNLVDVRQPGEYVKGHLPGARLIPVGELADRLGELDPARPTIVYCGAGVRSRAAASVLERAGFGEVYSMEGGIHSWQGLVAEGFPEVGISWFAAARSFDELMALAWLLEGGTMAFYAGVGELIADEGSAGLFRELAVAEQHHMETLAGLYRDISGDAADVDFTAILGKQPQEKRMEGGMLLDDALAWARGRDVTDILEFSISLETVSYDRYLTMQERITNQRSLKVFRTLAVEEKSHLGRLLEVFERYVNAN